MLAQNYEHLTVHLRDKTLYPSVDGELNTITACQRLCSHAWQLDSSHTGTLFLRKVTLHDPWGPLLCSSPFLHKESIHIAFYPTPLRSSPILHRFWHALGLWSGVRFAIDLMLCPWPIPPSFSMEFPSLHVFFLIWAIHMDHIPQRKIWNRCLFPCLPVSTLPSTGTTTVEPKITNCIYRNYNKLKLQF